MRLQTVLGLIVALALVSIASPPLAADAIDDYVERVLQRDKIPGIALLVMRDGKVIKEKGYGYANLEHRVPVTPETIFQSGSTGKQFTAAGILLLAEDGKLRLYDRLSQHFPGAPASWERITVRQLLTHTSGIKDYSDEFDYRRDYTDEELLATMQKLPLEFEPGTQWSYSNSGYLILGLLTTKLAGKHWSDFQAERIFQPLGMKTTRVISERDIVPHRAAGYLLDAPSRTLVNQDWVAPSLNRCADGALYFSIRDLAAWEHALAHRSFLSKEHFRDWWTAATFEDGTRYPYGFGWALGEQRGEAVIQHGGSWQGFRASIGRYPDQRLAVTVLANGAHAEPEAMAAHIAGLVEPRLRARETSVSVAPTSPSQREVARDAGEGSAVLLAVMTAWAQSRTTPDMAPSLAAMATGSAREAGNRKDLSKLLSGVTSFRILGEDALTPAAISLLADGSVTAIDGVLETSRGSVPVRFRLDGAGRVVSFQPDDRNPRP